MQQSRWNKKLKNGMIKKAELQIKKMDEKFRKKVQKPQNMCRLIK